MGSFQVESGKPTPVFFPIRALKIGPMSVNIKILETRQRFVSDEIFKTLLVKVWHICFYTVLLAS